MTGTFEAILIFVLFCILKFSVIISLDFQILLTFL